jgi:hypothetical protein
MKGKTYKVHLTADEKKLQNPVTLEHQIWNT